MSASTYIYPSVEITFEHLYPEWPMTYQDTFHAVLNGTDEHHILKAWFHAYYTYLGGWSHVRSRRGIHERKVRMKLMNEFFYEWDVVHMFESVKHAVQDTLERASRAGWFGMSTKWYTLVGNFKLESSAQEDLELLLPFFLEVDAFLQSRHLSSPLRLLYKKWQRMICDMKLLLEMPLNV